MHPAPSEHEYSETHDWGTSFELCFRFRCSPTNSSSLTYLVGSLDPSAERVRRHSTPELGSVGMVCSRGRRRCSRHQSGSGGSSQLCLETGARLSDFHRRIGAFPWACGQGSGHLGPESLRRIRPGPRAGRNRRNLGGIARTVVDTVRNVANPAPNLPELGRRNARQGPLTSSSSPSRRAAKAQHRAPPAPASDSGPTIRDPLVDF